MRERAIIYQPYEERAEWTLQCLHHCATRGYDWALFQDDIDEVGNLLVRQGGRLVVVARADHFRPVWLPRVEVVGDDTRRITREKVWGTRNEAPWSPSATAPRLRSNDRPRRLR